MTEKDKYAVVVDGDVIDTVPTKKDAKEVLASVAPDAEVEVRPFDPEKDVVKKPLLGDGIQHVR